MSGIEATRALDALVAKETEPPPQITGIWSKGYGTDNETNLVIKSLGSERYTWRYLTSIVNETNIPIEKIITSLDWLVANKLAIEEQGHDGKIWGLSSEGRSLLSAIVATENLNPTNV